MDGQRFDAFVRALATGVSRRRVLRSLIGGALLSSAAPAVSQVRSFVQDDQETSDCKNCFRSVNTSAWSAA
jgi:hypothetical protein